MSVSEKLLRCPFCGGPATVNDVPGNAWIACRKCNAASGEFAAPQDAADAWNARAADEERNRLIDALRRVRAWLAGYVANGGKDADEELQIADAALAADDRQVEAGSVVDRYRRSKATASPTPDEPESDGPLCALDNPPYLPPADDLSEDEVERVARALCVSHGQNPDARIEHVGAVDNYTRMWEAHKTHALAAIAALRNKR